MTPEQWTEWEQIVKECMTTSMWERKLAMLLIAVDAELEALRQLRSQISTALGFTHDGTIVSNEVLIATAHGYRKERDDLRAQVRDVMQAVDEVGYYKP